MDLEDQFSLEHLLFKERKCRTCGQVKDLLSDYYLTRKNRSTIASAYSYECKDCTIKRIVTSRMSSNIFGRWEYPDW
jgi:hypothetical protein